MWNELKKQLSVLEIFVILLVMATYALGLFIDFYQFNSDSCNPAFPYRTILLLLFAIFIVTSKLLNIYIDKDIQIVEYVICYTIRGISVISLIFYFLFFIVLLLITKI